MRKACSWALTRLKARGSKKRSNDSSRASESRTCTSTMQSLDAMRRAWNGREVHESVSGPSPYGKKKFSHRRQACKGRQVFLLEQKSSFSDFATLRSVVGRVSTRHLWSTRVPNDRKENPP